MARTSCTPSDLHHRKSYLEQVSALTNLGKWASFSLGVGSFIVVGGGLTATVMDKGDNGGHGYVAALLAGAAAIACFSAYRALGLRVEEQREDIETIQRDITLGIEEIESRVQEGIGDANDMEQLRRAVTHGYYDANKFTQLERKGYRPAPSFSVGGRFSNVHKDEVPWWIDN